MRRRVAARSGFFMIVPIAGRLAVGQEEGGRGRPALEARLGVGDAVAQSLVGGETVLGEADRRLEQRGPRAGAEPLVKEKEAGDRSRDPRGARPLERVLGGLA